jgi:hypothetical protein
VAVGTGTVTTAPLANGSTTTTVSFTSTSEPLYVEVAWWTTAISGITYGGVALTQISAATNATGGDRAEIWRLTSPTAGTANIVASHAAGQASGSIAIYNTTGQDHTTPEGTPGNANGASATTTGSQTVSGAAAGDLVIAAVAIGNGAAITPSASGGGAASELFDAPSNGEGAEGFKAADATTSISASWTGATSFAMAWVVLKASSGPLPPVGIPVGTPTWPFPHPPLRTD